MKASLPLSVLSTVPRSQVALGNALVPATLLRPSASNTSARRAQAPSATPKGLNHSAQGWRSSAYPGSIEKNRPNPERVESKLQSAPAATPSGLASFFHLFRVAAARQPFALFIATFSRLPEHRSEAGLMRPWLRLPIVGFVILLVTAVSAVADTTPALSSFHVAFLSNFDRDLVELYVGNEKIYSSVITTEATTGLAAWTDIPARYSRINLKVNVPRLHLTKTRHFSSVQGVFIYVSVLNNQLTFQQTKAPLALD